MQFAYPSRFRDLGPDEAFAAHRAVQRLLPRISYVPTAVGFCLLIRCEILREFGLFDPIYGGGYNEENDLIMRCNQRGYRAVLANHAFVYHLGNVSFLASSTAPSERETANRKILLSRYPEYERAVKRYFASPAFISQTLLAGLVPDAIGGRLRILFDARHLEVCHNGTFEFLKQTIRAFVIRYKDKFDICVTCSTDALVFHELDKVDSLSFCLDAETEIGSLAAVIRLAQPFDLSDLAHTVALAPISCYLMLDTIGLDCQHLDGQNLGEIWSSMLQTVSTIGYISEFSADQFRRRFETPSDIIQFVALSSTDVDEYGSSGVVPRNSEGNHILVVGNHYPHKHTGEMVEALSCYEKRPPVVALGVEIEEEPGLIGYRSGQLADDFVAELYSNASIVVFPSHYEGFGLPIMHALANGKPVICRDLPVAREIRAHSRFGRNIHLYKSTREMADAAVNPVPWVPARDPDFAEQTWAKSVETLSEAIEASIDALTYTALERRVTSLIALRRGMQAAGPDARGNAATPRNLAARLTRMGGKERSPASSDTIVVDARGDHAFESDILDAMDALILGGTLELLLPDESEPTLERAGVALAGAGFAVVSTGERNDGVWILCRKVYDWRQDIDVDKLDDEQFIAQLYHQILGRAPDSGGAAHYVAALAQGLTRAEIAHVFHGSDERRAYVKRQIDKTK